jgi:hypothetical protein
LFEAYIPGTHLPQGASRMNIFYRVLNPASISKESKR